MSTTQAAGGRYTAAQKGGRRQSAAGGGTQLLLSFLLIADLFLLYTVIMQLTHTQKVMELSTGVTYAALAILTVGAVALGAAVYLTGAWKRGLCLLLVFLILYLIIVFSNVPIVKKYRDMWISTAMNTMRHQGLATFYFPASVVEELTGREAEARSAQVGNNTLDTFNHEATDWMNDPAREIGLAAPDKAIEELPEDQQYFYRLFYELDRSSAEAYFASHPDVTANGYRSIFINATSLDGDGTSIRTKLGEKVLAIDTENQILIVECDADGSRGVLAIAKNPAMLHLCTATTLPAYGQVVGKIAKNNNGILAMTGSGFIDEGGVGNGGQIAGFARCGGKDYGKHYGWGYKRLELHENNWFYLRDAFTECSDDATDAMEFQPGLLINGERLDPMGWTGVQPRACIGQSTRGEILMLCVEGRRVASPGCSVVVCADILLAHDGINAINCDGGTTAIMWYRGEPIMRCSNSAIPQGRYLPNAWVIIP